MTQLKRINTTKNGKSYNKGEHQVLKVHQGVGKADEGIKAEGAVIWRSPSQEIIFCSDHSVDLPPSPLWNLTTTLLFTALPTPALAWSVSCLLCKKKNPHFLKAFEWHLEPWPPEFKTALFQPLGPSGPQAPVWENKENQLSHGVCPWRQRVCWGKPLRPQNRKQELRNKYQAFPWTTHTETSFNHYSKGTINCQAPGNKLWTCIVESY